MKVSNKGIELIKRFEGCRLTAYLCPARVWTIGYGHTTGVKKGQIISQNQADAYLESDLKKYEEYVNQTNLKLNQNQFDALVSFTYNCGNGNLKKLVRNRNVEQIGEAILLYNKSNGKVLNGLVRRREAEHDLFVQDVDEANTTEKFMAIKSYSKSVHGELSILQNFKVKEFACKDGTDLIKIDDGLVDYLQKARENFGVPIVITSAYRTEKYNKKIGGAKNSYHVKGQAADHHAKGKVDLLELARFYESIGCLGIIVYPNSGFVHIDMREKKYFAIDYGNRIIKKQRFE